MSQELENQVAVLKAENDKLKGQAVQNSQGIEGLLAQLDAHKGTLNESLNTAMQLRTNWILAQKQNKNLNDNIQMMQKTIDGLNKQLDDATKNIAALTPNPIVD